MDDERPWAEIDEAWRRKEERAMEQRAANAAALREGRPAPYVSFLAKHDPTKVDENASEEEFRASYREFCKICPPHQPKRHII